jgi:molybdopterin molybdotransferase
LRYVDIGVCAAAGAAPVAVSRRPRVALLSSGDELVAPGARPEPYQVTDVNTAMLSAAVLEAGGIPVPIGAVGDDRAAVLSALGAARDSADLIVSNAGVSVSKHDHVRDCVAQLGEVIVQTVNVRPGKPLVVGRVGSTPFVGLPGNPVSSAVTFLLFARPAILRMQGATQLLPPACSATLAEPFDKPAHLETYVRVRLESGPRGLVARSSGGQGSAMMHGLAAADALAVLPAGAGTFDAGTIVQALQLP